MRIPRVVWILLLLLVGYVAWKGISTSEGERTIKFQLISAKQSGPYVIVTLRNLGDEIRPEDLSFSTERGQCSPEGVPTIPSEVTVTLRLICPSGSRILTVAGGNIKVSQRIV